MLVGSAATRPCEVPAPSSPAISEWAPRSEEHTSELQSQFHIVCRLLLEKKNLRNLIADTDLILETTPDLPQNRTACCRENLRAALALADDLLKQTRVKAAVTLGRKGGSTTAKRHGVEHYFFF